MAKKRTRDEADAGSQRNVKHQRKTTAGPTRRASLAQRKKSKRSSKKKKIVGWTWTEAGKKPDGSINWIRTAKPGYVTVEYPAQRFLIDNSDRTAEFVESVKKRGAKVDGRSAQSYLDDYYI